jgi:Fe2+ or Zn2+ uptake regulation protein
VDRSFFLKKIDNTRFTQCLSSQGLRSTRQRYFVYEVILEKRDHPTAEEVFLRVKQKMPDISFATVYNCLGTLVDCDLVRQVNLDRSSSRFCPNMHDHCHFYCDDCGEVVDVDFPVEQEKRVKLPDGFLVTRFQLSISGLCSDCAAKAKTLQAA